MLAKIIVHANNRLEALRAMRTALDETIIEGIPTNITFIKRVIDDPDFVNGEINTGFIERMLH
jgi:acetyl-CoA carboxylase biotin carboxylase subunit